ncbi:M24 family metallopeptidase [Streptomyces albipurpureus]|uniref:M24 family metallopeptidase n=1 Tax=Streptomyces albipurpureus TaxID=2897419 RepID=A0ABT0UXH4_9ACTN|nr:M24 family metallopeptidase [Streptomyces sp. CWNU-1]MCM2391871.1 M24 family metallopeptidase [Streptomyces sp. CWNU-1]
MSTTARTNLPNNTLSLAERDRRHALVRKYLRAAGAEAIIASGHNAFYLTNGIPGENYAVLTANEAPVTCFVNGRHIIDIPVAYLLDAQEWIEDIRPASDHIHSPRQVGDTSEIVARIRELGLAKGARVGVDSGLNHLVVEQLTAAMPDVELIQLADVFASARTVKSAEELAIIEEACRIWDSAVQTIRGFVRPGMPGAQVVQEGIRAMWAEGADVDTRFYLSFGKHASQNPAVAELCLSRPIEAGDMLTLTSMARYRGYIGHTDQQISMGEPSRLHADMFASILEVRRHVLSHVKPGVLHSDLAVAYREAAEQTPFKFSKHSQIHQFGMDAPEYPGGSHRIQQEFVPGREEQPDFVLAPGMVYSISPTLISQDDRDVLLGGTDLTVTESGYRELQAVPVQLLVA